MSTVDSDLEVPGAAADAAATGDTDVPGTEVTAARRGVTAEEVAEAMGVAIAMNGGPGTVWAPRAYAAFEEFAAASGPGVSRPGS